MAASIVKLAPPNLVKQSIIDLNEPKNSGSVTQTPSNDPDQSATQSPTGTKTQTHPQSTPCATNGSVSTGDLVECRQWLQRWLDRVVGKTLSVVFSSSPSSSAQLATLPSSLGLSTRLACAIQHYNPHLIGTNSKKFEVCLDHCQAALLDGRTSLTEAIEQDEVVNSKNVHRLLRAQLAAGNQCPIHSFHLIEQLGTEAHLRSLTPAQEVRLLAEFFNWLSSPAPTSTAVVAETKDTHSAAASQSVLTRSHVPDSVTCSSSIQNGVLRNLVQTSGIVARPARPAHPNSRPIALLNTSTVEQLVVSSTSDNAVKPSNTVVREAETTSVTPDSHPSGLINGTTAPLPMTTEREPTDDLLADLARVASGAAGQQSNGACQDSGTRLAGGYFVAPQNTNADLNLGSATVPVDSSPLVRNNLYATFTKRPTPSLSDKLPTIGSPSRKPTSSTVSRPGGMIRSSNFSSPQHAPVSAVPSLRSEFEKRRRSHSTVAANHPDRLTGQTGPKTMTDNIVPHGTKTWATTGGARQSARKTNTPDSTADNAISSTDDGTRSKVPVSRSAAAALRLSLDQRRRAIEASRQRILDANHKAATQRNHAAFQKLLKTEQRRRAKKDEPDASDQDVNSTSVVSQSDGDHVISSSAADQGMESPNQVNGSELYDVDQSVVSASQRGQGTDVDDDFSMRSTDAVTAQTRIPPQPQQLLDQPILKSGDDQQSHEHIVEPGKSLIEAAITPDELVPSSKETSPTPSGPKPSQRNSTQDFAESSAVPAAHSPASGQQPEPDQTSSEAMEFINSLASEQPVRSVSPVNDWYASMPERHPSSGNPQPTNANRSLSSSRRLREDEEFPVECNSSKVRGPRHAIRGVPQRRVVGPPSSHKSPMTRRKRQPQCSGAPANFVDRRFELTSQSLSVESRNRSGRQNSRLVPQPQRLRTSRHGRVNRLAASEDFDWPAGVTNSMDPEWDEPGDDEYDDEDEESYTNGNGSQNYSGVDDEDDEEVHEDYDTRRSVNRGIVLMCNSARGSTTDTEDDESLDPVGLRRSHSNRYWRNVDRFSSERSSIAYSTSGRRPGKGRYKKRDQLRASYDPSASSHRGFRPTEAVVKNDKLEKLDRRLLGLQSDLERLCMQQEQVLLASSSATAAVALVAGANNHQAFLNPHVLAPASGPIAPAQLAPISLQPSGPSGFTRAMWSERSQLPEFSQAQAHAAHIEPVSAEQVPHENSIRSESSEPSVRSQLVHSNEAAPPAPANQAFFVDLNTQQRSPSPTEPKAPPAPALEPTPPPAEKSDVPTATEKSSASQVFFIGFEEPDPQLMQRKCDRLEARRAAEKALAAQQLEALRSNGREEKLSQELAELERKNTERERREAILQAYLNRREQSEMQCHRFQNPYPVRPGSAALSRSTANLSSKGKRSTPHTASKSLQRNSDLRSSQVRGPRGSSGTRTSRVTKSAAPNARGNADGEAVEPSEADVEERHERRMIKAAEASQKQRQGPSEKPTGRMTSGLSLSSLHRLGAADLPSSGPGVSVAGLSQPKLFVKPKAKSNRMVIANAIGHCCLAGAVNEPLKQATLKDLAATEGTHFMILFRDARCQYRAVYVYDLELEELRLICGTGPRKITHDMANRFFKYNSGGKHFTQITSTNHLSPVVDAITIHDALWSKQVHGRPA